MSYVNFLSDINRATGLRLTFADGYTATEFKVSDWHATGGVSNFLMIRATLPGSFRETIEIGDDHDGKWHRLDISKCNTDTRVMKIIVEKMGLRYLGNIKNYDYYAPAL